MSKHVVLGIFPDEAAADAAAHALKEWDYVDDDVKVNAIGVLALDDNGTLKTHKLGPRTWGKGAGIGFVLAIVAPPTVVAGAVAGGALGALHKKGLGIEDADRELLGNTLRSLRRTIGDRGAAEQLLHGEPHPGNVLSTRNGLLFIDLETCCRGPVEFDLAHAPEEVSEHYPGVNRGLLRECRILVLAMITTWRWDRGDQLPNGRQLGTEWLSQIRAVVASRAQP